MKKVFIRYGHEILSNGSYTAANNNAARNTLREHTGCREYGEILENIFKDEGYKVNTFRASVKKYKDVNSALKAGVDRANAWGADVFISVHLNAYGSGANGTEVLYYPTSSNGKKLAQKVNDNIVKALRTTDRGAKEKDFYELRETNCPAIIVEPLFCDNPDDCSKYDAEKIAVAIYEGVTGNKYQTYTFPCDMEVTGRVNARCTPTTNSCMSHGQYKKGKRLIAWERSNNGSAGWYLCEDPVNGFKHWVSGVYLKEVK